jgi:mono/diheme cytochrome c family protein
MAHGVRNVLIFGLMAGVVFFLFLQRPAIVEAQDPDELLEDPVVKGAWLYQGNCVRCHGDYGDERPGRRYYNRGKKELREAIEFAECEIKWGRTYDGPFGNDDIKAVAAYIAAWEEAGGPPDLPDLPDQPTPTPRPTPTVPSSGEEATATPTPELIDEYTQLVLDGNEVAKGAWLYMQQCYRCHQSYAGYRQGMGMERDAMKEIIEKGKTATQMTAFARKNGGELLNSEIEAIVEYMYVWEALGAEPALPERILAAPTVDPTMLEPVTLPEVPLVEGDVENGARFYAMHCAECHGVIGEGYIGPRLARPWLVVRPDLTIKSAIAMGVPGSSMTAWGDTAGGPLDEDQINDLTAYVISLAQPADTVAVQSAGLGSSGSSPLAGWLGLLILVAGGAVMLGIGVARSKP